MRMIKLAPQMEQDFRLPTFEAIDLIHEARFHENKAPLVKYISDNLMIGLYNNLVSEGTLPKDDEFYQEISQKITAKKEEISAKYQAEISTTASEKQESEQKSDKETSIESEELKKHIAIAEFIASTCDYQSLIDYISKNNAEPKAGSLRMDLLLCKFRISTLLHNKKEADKLMNTGLLLVEESCDWDRRNKFKTYYGMHMFMTRDYESAAKYFYESLPTFDSKEVFDYNRIVLMYILSALMHFDRQGLQDKVFENGDVNETRELNQTAIEFVEGFLKCEYDTILTRLYLLCKVLLCEDPIFASFQNIFIRKMISRLFDQLLKSYKSLSIDSIASIFGVSPIFVEDYLFDFIASGDINAKIDGVSRNVFVFIKEVNEQKDFTEKTDIILQNIAQNIKM